MFSPEFENSCPSYALRPINQFRNGHSLRMGSIAKAREAETQRGERECRHRCSYSPVRFEHEQAQAALTFFPLLNSYSSSCKFTLCLNLSQQNSWKYHKKQMNVNPRFILNPARVAQWIRRPPPKRKIGGSSPPVGNPAFASAKHHCTACKIFKEFSKYLSGFGGRWFDTHFEGAPLYSRHPTLRICIWFHLTLQLGRQPNRSLNTPCVRS